MLKSLSIGDGNNLGTYDGKIALDCSIRETKHGHIVISTTDFFFPLVDSPYVQGMIGAANVLSDIYAEGVYEVDFILMLLAVCHKMPTNIRQIVTSEMVRGFNRTCSLANTVVTGGQTVLNPWPIIGGVATSIISKDEYISSDGAQIGNVILLTKPLGTQIAVNVHQWKTKYDAAMKLKDNNNDDDDDDDGDIKRWRLCQTHKDVLITNDDVNELVHMAICSMVQLNKNSAKLMMKYNATSCTDVTGFGILGHAQNLVENQKISNNLIFHIHTLPILKHCVAINNNIFNFQLVQGYSAETSGGLFITLPNETIAKQFITELKELDDTDAWIIGTVLDASSSSTTTTTSNDTITTTTSCKNIARISDTVKIIEV